jgi:Flagellar protein FlbT
MAACLPRIRTNDVLKTSWTVALRRAFEQVMIVPLRVELKPFERIVFGDVVLINSGSRSSFLIDGDARLLREKGTLSAETANTPAKRLYLCVQTMYLKNDVPRYRTSYLGLLQHPRETDPASPRDNRCRQRFRFRRCARRSRRSGS